MQPSNPHPIAHPLEISNSQNTSSAVRMGDRRTPDIALPPNSLHL